MRRVALQRSVGDSLRAGSVSCRDRHSGLPDRVAPDLPLVRHGGAPGASPGVRRTTRTSDLGGMRTGFAVLLSGGLLMVTSLALICGVMASARADVPARLPAGIRNLAGQVGVDQHSVTVQIADGPPVCLALPGANATVTLIAAPVGAAYLVQAYAGASCDGVKERAAVAGEVELGLDAQVIELAAPAALKGSLRRV